MSAEGKTREGLTIGSLFSGIGGLELGLERAGLGPVIWQAESDPFARKVLAKHWPGVKVYEDVREVDERAERPGIICGGFPCQDISDAGHRVGIDGARSGLWAEYARIIRSLRPRFVVVENVAALLGRGMGRVLGDLAAFGYDAEWACLPACSFGAPHIRDRVFILAYPGERGAQVLPAGPGAEGARTADAAWGGEAAPLRSAGDAQRRRLEGGLLGQGDAPAKIAAPGRSTSLGTYLGEAWPTEPGESWLDDGLSGAMAEISSRLLGNAVVPQVAEWIGRRIAASLVPSPEVSKPSTGEKGSKR